MFSKLFFMAAFPICYKTPHKDQNLPNQSALRQNDKRFMCDCVSMLRSSLIPGCHLSYKVSNVHTERDSPRCIVHGRSSFYKTVTEEIIGIGRQDSHISIFRRCYSQRENLSTGVNQESPIPSCFDENDSEESLAANNSRSINADMPKFRKPNNYVDIRTMKGLSYSATTMNSQQQDETSSLYLIGTLVSVNIAVFLFEIASPIRNADFQLFSIPLLYGAKINHLIMVGEWWRLVTPMFLHAGIFHMALSCWALVTFGPQVCRGYGSFTFFLIYILGGISGNLTSFLHTPDPTVGGTGPVFAIIGAWLMYQIQNRDVIANDALEDKFQKAIIVTALGFILCNLGPIDEWTHFGAAFTGMAFGFLTSPALQLNDASSGSGQEEGLKLVSKHGDSCKSLIVFTIFIIVLSSFLFFMEPPLNALASFNSAAANDLEYM